MRVRDVLFGALPLALMVLLCKPAVAASSCGAGLSELHIAGQSASGKVVVYYFQVKVESQAALGAHVSLTDGLGKTFTLNIPEYTPSHSRVDTVRFAWPGPQVRSVRLLDVRTGESATNCDGDAITLHPIGNTDTTLSFPEVAPSWVPPPNAEPRAAPFFQDADFISRVEPDYPADVAHEGIGGDTYVLITLGHNGGTPSNAIVTSSSQDRELDDYAIDAAMRSTFRPAKRAGVGVPSIYRIVYAFQGYQHQRFHQRVTDCGLKLDHMLLEGYDRVTNRLLYETWFVADSNTIASVLLGFDDQDQETLKFTASDWTKRSDGKYTAWVSFVMANIVGQGTLVNSQVAGEGEKSCKPIAIRAWDDSGGMLQTRDADKLANAPAVHGLTQVTGAQYTQRVWASYPDPATTGPPQGETVVLVRLGKSPHPIDATIFGSCGNPVLDQAALAAARASSYRHEGIESTWYLAQYGFEPHIPGYAEEQPR